MKTCGRRKISLYVCCVQNDFLSKTFWYIFTSFLYSLVPYSARMSMDENAGNVRKPKKVGGRTKIHNNCEGLSEDVIITKNLRTPPSSSDEDQKTRDNRLREIRRLQALRWYKYKHIIPRWDVLFALKNLWSDVTALKSG